MIGSAKSTVKREDKMTILTIYLEPLMKSKNEIIPALFIALAIFIDTKILLSLVALAISI